MIWVAAAGPGMNLALATAAALLLHTVDLLPVGIGQWLLRNLVNAININVFLAVFNLRRSRPSMVAESPCNCRGARSASRPAGALRYLDRDRGSFPCADSRGPDRR